MVSGESCSTGYKHLLRVVDRGLEWVNRYHLGVMS